MNKKGAVPIVVIVAASIIAGVTTLGTVKTAKNGTLKKNGQLIWCKMQNKGNDYCDSVYR